MEKYKEIERSIIKTHRKEIWGRFVKGVQDYKMISSGDRVMVCISGGKDSFLLAKCIQELQRHGNVSFEAHYVVMNPGYSEKHLDTIRKNAELLNVPIEIFSSDVFAVLDSVETKSPCYLCARMRRGHLYNKARELGCSKIALGHHFDDVIETTLLSMFYGSEIKTMMPKLHSDNYNELELIRPLFLVKEASILSWMRGNGLAFINCACRFTEALESSDENKSKRLMMKKLVKELRRDNPEIDNNIFKALDNINLNCVLGTKKDGKYASFLETYDE